MSDYKPEEIEALQDLYEAQIEFADKLGNCIAKTQRHIEELQRQKGELIKVASELTDRNMTLITFREKRQVFLDLVAEIE